MSRLIPKQAIEEIRTRNDIVEIIQSYIELKRAGSGYKALCPFHKEVTPSFTVNAQHQSYHCFGCNAGGDVFKFIMEYDGVDFSTAVQLLAQKSGIILDTYEENPNAVDKASLFKLHEQITTFYHQLLLTNEHAKRARDYLEKRQIDISTIQEYAIGYAPDKWDGLLEWAKKNKISAKLLKETGLLSSSSSEQARSKYYDRFRDRIMFPIKDELGRIVGFSGRLLKAESNQAKYVNSPETLIFQKGNILYGLDKARRSMVEDRSVLLCEGQIDVIRCHKGGFKSAVAPQGTALTEKQANLLQRYTDEVILLYDADRAGQDASLRAADVCLSAGLSVKIAVLPKGEDPDTLLRHGGQEQLRAVIQSANSMLEYQITLLKSREDLGSEKGLIHSSSEILKTIQKAPNAIQQEKLIHQASSLLGLHIESLRKELDKLPMAKQIKRGDIKQESPQHQYPAHEVALAELLIEHPPACALIKKYLPLDNLYDQDCKELIKNILNSTQDQPVNLMDTIANNNERSLKLAAKITATPVRDYAEDCTPLSKAQDLILFIRRKHFERQRTYLRQQVREVSKLEQEQLTRECHQLTYDIQILRQGWEKALPILEL